MIDKEIFDILNNIPGIKLSVSGLINTENKYENCKNKIEFKVKNKK